MFFNTEINKAQLKAFIERSQKTVDLDLMLKDYRMKINESFDLSKNEKVLMPLANIFAYFDIEGFPPSSDDFNFLHIALNNHYEYFINTILTNIKKPNYSYSAFMNDQQSFYDYIGGGLTPDELKEWKRVEYISKDAGVNFKNKCEWVMPLSEDNERLCYSRVEGKVGKHCGNSYKQNGTDFILSLRTMTPPDVHMTMIVDENGFIIESKGKSNSKLNVSKYKEEMKFILDSEYVKGIRIDESRYSNNNNFYIVDFLGVDNEYANEKIKDENFKTSYDEDTFDIISTINNNKDTNEIYTAILNFDEYKNKPYDELIKILINLKLIGKFINATEDKFIQMFEKGNYGQLLSLISIFDEKVLLDKKVLESLFMKNNSISIRQAYVCILHAYHLKFREKFETDAKILEPYINEKLKDKMLSFKMDGRIILFFNNVVCVNKSSSDYEGFVDMISAGDVAIVITKWENIELYDVTTVDNQGNESILFDRIKHFVFIKRNDEENILMVKTHRMKTAPKTTIYNCDTKEIILEKPNVDAYDNGFDRISVTSTIESYIIDNSGEIIIPPYESIRFNMESGLFYCVKKDSDDIDCVDYNGKVVDSYVISGLPTLSNVIDIGDDVVKLKNIASGDTEYILVDVKDKTGVVISKTRYKVIDMVKINGTFHFKCKINNSTFDYYTPEKKLVIENTNELLKLKPEFTGISLFDGITHYSVNNSGGMNFYDKNFEVHELFNDSFMSLDVCYVDERTAAQILSSDENLDITELYGNEGDKLYFFSVFRTNNFVAYRFFNEKGERVSQIKKTPEISSNFDIVEKSVTIEGSTYLLETQLSKNLLKMRNANFVVVYDVMLDELVKTNLQELEKLLPNVLFIDYGNGFRNFTNSKLEELLPYKNKYVYTVEENIINVALEDAPENIIFRINNNLDIVSNNEEFEYDINNIESQMKNAIKTSPDMFKQFYNNMCEKVKKEVLQSLTKEQLQDYNEEVIRAIRNNEEIMSIFEFHSIDDPSDNIDINNVFELFEISYRDEKQEQPKEEEQPKDDKEEQELPKEEEEELPIDDEVVEEPTPQEKANPELIYGQPKPRPKRKSRKEVLSEKEYRLQPPILLQKELKARDIKMPKNSPKTKIINMLLEDDKINNYTTPTYLCFEKEKVEKVQKDETDYENTLKSYSAPKLRKLLRDNKIEFKNSDKKETLIKLLLEKKEVE